MRIDVAIELIQEMIDGCDHEEMTDHEDAMKLGIEALKVIKEFRTGRYKTINSPLLGETGE